MSSFSIRPLPDGHAWSDVLTPGLGAHEASRHSLFHPALQILLAQVTALAVVHLVRLHAPQIDLHDLLTFP